MRWCSQSSPRDAAKFQPVSSSHGRPPASPSSSAGIAACRSSSSSVIPLPKTHIHRTPSELQLADEVRRAEYDDVRMYARLVVGMQSQIQRDYYANGGVVHPLSKKSLQGVVRTKQARYDELNGGKQDDDDVDYDGGGWKLSYVEEDEKSVDSPWSTRAHCDPRHPPSKSGSDSSLSTREPMIFLKVEDNAAEDDFVFCLEL